MLHYFREHNIISFKSLGDRVGQDHIIELLSYYAGYAPPERLPDLAQIVQRPDPAGLEKNILDKLKESLYIRIKSFEPEDLWEGIMPTAMEADITDLVMPYLEKIRAESELRGELRGKLEGKIEGKLETAHRLRRRGLDLAIIAEDTGLTLEELKAAGIE
ncbi:MAG: hypothetical protein HS115_10950 [Spirochaetales bacterium]|nr:hypothetical protein [Spirochaetales bacterium]